MKIQVVSPHKSNGHIIGLTCPSCGRRGTFERIGIEDIVSGPWHLGQRFCPNPQCHAHVFVVIQGNNGEVKKCYPALRIDFDSANIPENIVSCFEESITAHAEGCYRAAAIMVRRTLEELCKQHSATGKDLKARIESLKNNITIPRALIDGFDNLRLLGNDAAHVEAQVFDEVGEEEVRLAIDVTKEILKAIYQYDSLIGRLNALKKQP